MALTQEQLEALLGMSDIGGLESTAADQMALARNLRGTGTAIRGKDVGSNIGRAAYGIGGAIGDYKGMSARPEITRQKQGLLAALMRKREEPFRPGVDAPIYGEEGE